MAAAIRSAALCRCGQSMSKSVINRNLGCIVIKICSFFYILSNTFHIYAEVWGGEYEIRPFVIKNRLAIK